MLDRIERLIVGVRDLAAACADYQRLLGRSPLPLATGTDPDAGRAVFELGNALLELRVCEHAGCDETSAPTRPGFEGLWGLSFGTPDLAACCRQLPEYSECGSRLELVAQATRGLRIYIAQCDRDLRRSEVNAHAADVEALDHVVVRSADPQAAVALYGGALQLRLALDRQRGATRMLFFRVGGVTFEVVQDPALGAHDVWFGAAYRVRDIEAAHVRLLAEGFSLSAIRPGNKPNTQVFSVRDHTCDVPSLIVRDPARDAR